MTLQIALMFFSLCWTLFNIMMISYSLALLEIFFSLSWFIFLYPTYQVFKCSPIQLKNADLGTLFKLKTEEAEAVEISYTTSECCQNYKYLAPYWMSLYSPKISLVIDFMDLTKIIKGNPSYYVAVSQRSVKKRIYKLNLLVKVPQITAAIALENSFNLTSREKKHNVIIATGSFQSWKNDELHIKNGLEKDYLVRSMTFVASQVKYRNKYEDMVSPTDGYNHQYETFTIIVFFIGLVSIFLFLSQYNQIRSVIYLYTLPFKFIPLFVWPIYVMTIYGVWKCSPVTLNNENLGSMFKLNTKRIQFLQASYEKSPCYHNLKYKAPFNWSPISPKILLRAHIYDFKDLRTKKIAQIDKYSKVPWQESDSSLFLIKSRRTVKGTVHTISLLTEASGNQAKIIKDSLSKNNHDNKLLFLTGTVESIGDELLPLKKSLETMKDVHIRPFVFVVYSVAQ